MTSGRLGREFESYAQTLTNVNCTYADQILDPTIDISKFNVYAGFGSELSQTDISGFDWIHSFGAGIDAFINHPDIQDHTLISRTIGELGLKIAEYCLTYSLLILKNVNQLSKNQKTQIWEQIHTNNLKDQNILIYGTGSIGSAIAAIFRPLANKVVGVNFNGNANANFDLIYKRDVPATEAGSFNIIINTLPLTNKTSAFFNNSVLSRFTSVIFINVGRGKSMVIQDLEMALVNRNISYAVLDVFDIEPLPPYHSLWKNQKVIITPHQAGITTIEEVKVNFEKAIDNFYHNKESSYFTSSKKGY